MHPQIQNRHPPGTKETRHVRTTLLLISILMI